MHCLSGITGRRKHISLFLMWISTLLICFQNEICARIPKNFSLLISFSRIHDVNPSGDKIVHLIFLCCGEETRVSFRLQISRSIKVRRLSSHKLAWLICKVVITIEFLIWVKLYFFMCVSHGTFHF